MPKILHIVCLVYLALNAIQEWFYRLKLRCSQLVNILEEDMGGKELNTQLQLASQLKHLYQRRINSLALREQFSHLLELLI